MPAKAEVFHEGDHVVYPTHGVGRVERIAIEEIAGHKLELIHITFEENRMTLRVPVAKARSAGLRKLSTRKQFDAAMAVLKGKARIKRTMWSRRAQEYEAKINSGDPLAIAEVVRDLRRNAGQPDQSFSERQIYESAMDRLAAELAALDRTDKVTAISEAGRFPQDYGVILSEDRRSRANRLANSAAPATEEPHQWEFNKVRYDNTSGYPSCGEHDEHCRLRQHPIKTGEH